ncbi:MAG: sigma-70 family RNA polymerase sigma factor [Nocardioidaceae bacterium]|nr:sigma-70 family RNA polymerase sigma factor [Nocardioidaceae bacterium]
MVEARAARFEALAAQVAGPLRRYAARRTDPETAQDVVAEALLVAWRRLDEIPVGGELPWCYAVARGCLANATRSARRQRGLVARIVQIDKPGVVQPMEPDLPDPALHRALGLLPEIDREALRLWAWDDLSPAEIARVLDVSVNAVNIRLHRARKRLVALLADDQRKDPDAAGQETVVKRRTR